VLVFFPYLSDERAEALDVQLAEFDAVRARADVISLHVPLTDATSGLIGAAQFARM
jgi:phosphoglycerate dehydrogenase-like enzyme